MRTINILRNSFYALTSLLLSSILGIIVRKYFTVHLSVEFLGLEGVFSNVVTMLSFAELGIGTIISYNLYRELSSKNEKEINVLMNIYRLIYTAIGILVCLLGGGLFFFLPFIVKETSLPWYYVQFVYFVQIITILSSYFLAYKRTLLIADQKDYLCIRVDMCCNVLCNIMRLIAIVYYHSYILFSLVGLFFNIVANFVIVYIVKKKYSYVYRQRVTIKEIKDRNIICDVKNLLIQKISGFIYGGSDSIFISTMLGIKVAGLMSNYQLLSQGVFSVMYKALQGVVPSIGNLVYESDEEKKNKVFRTLDFLYLILASYLAVIYAIFLHPFIKLFFGDSFLLPESLLIVWALFVFIMVQFENLCNFRSTVGMFDKDRIYLVLSAFVKLVIGIPAVYLFGVTGLLIASLIGWCFIGYGRLNIVFNYILKSQKKSQYMIQHLIWSIIEIVIVALLYKFFYLCNFHKTIIELICSLLAIFILLTIFNFLIFYRTKEFKNLLVYIKRTIGVFVKRA